MRWRGRRTSRHLEDRRGMRMSPRAAKGGGFGILAFAVVVALLGGDPIAFLSMIDGEGTAPSYQQTAPISNKQQDQLAEFTSVVLADTEDVWTSLFRQQGIQYQYPKLVLFSGVVQSACGRAGAATGPFYCPGDRKIYIDLSFYRELQQKLGAPGDFAQAYVIAHEVGHHVQTLLGTSQKVRQAQRRLSRVEGNKMLVRLELQADCYAGVWAHHADKMHNILEDGDIEEAMRAAHQIGDDRLQRAGQGYVVPDSFTHGTSAQRKQWFGRGLQRGQMAYCNTFQ